MSYISAILTAAVVNNYVLARGFGFTSALSASKNKDICKFFVCLFVEMLAVGLVAFGLSSVMATAAFAQNMIYVVVIALVAYVLNKFVNKSGYNIFLFLCLNTCVFALALDVNGLEIADALVQIVAAFAGFVLATYLLKGVTSRINQKVIPAPFKGLPIEVLAAGIISLALYAFK